jgi:hypothetical protein
MLQYLQAWQYNKAIVHANIMLHLGNNQIEIVKAFKSFEEVWDKLHYDMIIKINQLGLWPRNNLPSSNDAKWWNNDTMFC